jgi:hypothetical protein
MGSHFRLAVGRVCRCCCCYCCCCCRRRRRSPLKLRCFGVRFHTYECTGVPVRAKGILGPWSCLTAVPVGDPAASGSPVIDPEWLRANYTPPVITWQSKATVLDLSDPLSISFAHFAQVPVLQLAAPTRVDDHVHGPLLHTGGLVRHLLTGPVPVSVTARTGAGESVLHLAVRTGVADLVALVTGTRCA